MSENLNRGARDFSRYDTMATADLEEILRLDAEIPEGAESDTELLLYVMGVLADRRRNNAHAGKTAFEAWESFEKNYMPEEEAARVSRKTGLRFAPWLRRSVAAAAVVALLVCLPLTAQAFGLGNLWDVFARWAKETFAFVQEGNEDYSEPDLVIQEEFTSLQDALEKSNRDPSIVPSWIPEDFVINEVIKDITPFQEVFIAHYSAGNKTINIFVQSYLHEDPEKLEINESLIEIYPHSGIDYYIFRNMDNMQIAWINDSFECNITGDISIDEIYLIIDSIGSTKE